MQHSILIFKMKAFCYNSSVYFADKAAEYFRNKGWDCEVYDASQEENAKLNAYAGRRSDAILDAYAGRHFDAILDFNSNLPKMVTDDGRYFPDAIDGPFYNYILDHPLYHHDMLEVQLRDYHVICPDNNHKLYIERWYKHIKSCHVLPVAGSGGGVGKNISTRPIEVLFTGTYTNPEHILSMIFKMPDERQAEMSELLKRQLKDINAPLEKVLYDFLEELKLAPEEVDLPLRMSLYFPIDAYMAALSRQKAVSTLAEAGIPLTLVGHGWEKLGNLAGKTNVTVRPPVDYVSQFDMMANSKLVLNVMPGFKAGIHDRVFSTMLNGAVALSDNSTMLESEFVDGEDIVIFSPGETDKIADRVEKLLRDNKRMEEMARRGQDKCIKAHTWTAHLEILEKIILTKENAS